VIKKRRQVDDWLARCRYPMRDVFVSIRLAILVSDPRIDECIKSQVPTFVYNGNLASFDLRSPQHASVMFPLGGLIPGRHPRLTGTGDGPRLIQFASMAEAAAARTDLERLVRNWCDWRDSKSPVRK